MESLEAGRWVTSRIGTAAYKVDISARTHTIVADEPIPVGGTDAGPTPYEYLLAAMGSCMVMTLRLYADRKQWPLEGASVQLRTSHSHEKDCEDCEKQKVGIGRIERRVELFGTLTDEQRTRLLEIADRCPVKQSLERGIRIESVGSDNEPR